MLGSVGSWTFLIYYGFVSGGFYIIFCCIFLFGLSFWLHRCFSYIFCFSFCLFDSEQILFVPFLLLIFYLFLLFIIWVFCVLFFYFIFVVRFVVCSYDLFFGFFIFLGDALFLLSCLRFSFQFIFWKEGECFVLLVYYFRFF